MSTIEFTQHFSQFQGLLYSFAFRLTRNEEEAQDLVQETAYKAYKYRNMYQTNTNLRAWLMTIMRNTFINNYRQKKRRKTLNDQSRNNYLLNSGNRTVENGGESNVTTEELWKLVHSLEDWLRIPFLMHFQGYKYEEIANELDIPLGTVKSRIFFARRKLQESVQSTYQSRQLHEILD